MMTTKQEFQLRSDLTTAHTDFQKGMNTHAFFKVSNSAMAEDLVQDAFIKTWNYLLKGGKIEMMRAFLYHVLNNLIIDQYRKQKPVSLDLLRESGFEPSLDPSKRLFNFIDGKAAGSLIKQLPKMYQKMTHMRYVQNLSIEEVGFLTGKSNNCVSVQTHRGLEKLKVLYSNQ